jgi:hypothetical protein
MHVDEIHEGDELARAAWQWEYWGVEPMAKKRSDWLWRYASVFRVPESRISAPKLLGSEDVGPHARRELDRNPLSPRGR